MTALLPTVRFPRLKAGVPIVDDEGKPTIAFLTFINDLANIMEGSTKGINSTINDVTTTLETVGIIVQSVQANQITLNAQAKQTKLTNSYTDPATAILTASVPVDGNCVISVAAHTRIYSDPDKTEVAVSAGTVSGAIPNTTYVVYYSDSTMAGGTVTYFASTDANMGAQTGNIHRVGNITTPTVGATEPGTGSGGGVPGGGGYCIWEESVTHDGTKARELEEGDALLVLQENGRDYFEDVVQGVRHAVRPCVKLKTVSGITLTVSAETPITLLDGGTVRADKSKGHFVAVLDRGEFRWEVIADVKDVGDLPVVLVSTWDRTYAAGDRSDRLIFSHNKTMAVLP